MRLNIAFELLAVLLVGGESGFIGFEFPIVRFEGFLDYGDVSGQRGYFFFECCDFLV